MASQLLDTKLFVPMVRGSLVARSRLSQSLARGAVAKLTLISAPAGFGKTTALAAWLAHGEQQRSVAWVSLDESDRQPASFFTYVVAALHRAAPTVGAGVLPVLRAAQPPVETVLTTVLNELGALPHGLDLVLDDYHLADGPDVAAGVAFLLEHLPPRVHVVISSRVDPDLPLARLRACGELVEVRAADLRFTREEVSAYFTDTAGLNLTGRDIAALEERTEGWIAALQLAALSLRGRPDVAAFIAGFAGGDRYIVDYLVEEVLARQPDDVRTFLVQTCILDRMTGPLCDAVTGRYGGRAMLESLERANLFVVPLDDNRRWYRYHHLFADVLRTYLPDEHPEQVAELHRRASRWYDQAGEVPPAVRHALACGDVDRAAELVERAIPALQRGRQEATIRGWLDDLPDEVVRVRPVLASGFVGALMSMGEFDDAPRRLRDVERWLGTDDVDGAGTLRRPSGMRVVDDAEFARLPGIVQLHRAGLALVAGDASGTHRHARLAIARAAPGDHVTRAGASALSGLASWAAGDLQAALRCYRACIDGLTDAGHIADVLGCSITVADLLITQGRLGDALATYEHALAARGPGVLRGTADMYVGISQIALERGDPTTADAYLQRSQDLGEHLGLPQNPYRSRVALARLRHAQGDPAGAVDLLEEAQRVYTGDFSPNVRPIAALKARMLAATGQVGEAVAWAAEHHLSVDDNLSYLREYEHITLAAVLLARYRAQRLEPTVRDASRLLERLLVAAEKGRRTSSVIEILMLQALAQHARGEVTGALSVLKRAARLAEPEGHVQVFLEAGPPVVALLRLLANKRPTWTYVRRLLAAAAPPAPALAPPAPALAPSDVSTAQMSANRFSPARVSAVPATLVPQPVARNVVDPLSKRELQVLRLLATDLDGPDVARRLVVSVNTLRTHTRNIYAKLGVNSRRAAVRRAGELNLL